MVLAQSSPAFISRRKCGIAGIVLMLFLIFFYAIRERYFYRADVLIAIQTDVRWTQKVDEIIKKSGGGEKTEESGVFSYFGFGGETSSEKAKAKKKLDPWDKWMSEQTSMTSIGDIYNRCDNKTRTKIGKVVLETKKDGSGVQIKSFLNQTYDYEIVASTANMEVYYNDDLLYTKVKDMCEAAKELDTPYSCPVKSGHTLVIQDVAKMPSYIPKGKYRVFSNIIDQNKKEIGCTYIEFKTGETG